ncbi:fluoride efflux transporter CrcB [Jiangella mangrovi]|uniref:Fluoride-specific ion channel FluC n=1 Tax=Jiangella mangrovi TaxID=1524084 RepID=A0A7W9LPR9_9ACTN|nr:fluoride efflux transporter CrcB [Jiangella mangrovi]MBB5791576.1 CrcB protein [Jiangella mangrovi]
MGTARGQASVLAAIAAGGVLGSLARHGAGVLWPSSPPAWPVTTLLVNASGCLLIGVLMAVLLDLTAPHRLLRPFLGIGVLGGYTTFSTYAVDVQRLLVDGREAAALTYVLLTPVVALVAVWLGTAATRAWRRRRHP